LDSLGELRDPCDRVNSVMFQDAINFPRFERR